MSAVLLVFGCLYCYFLLSAFAFICRDALWLISYLLVTSCFTLRFGFSAVLFCFYFLLLFFSLLSDCLLLLMFRFCFKQSNVLRKVPNCVAAIINLQHVAMLNPQLNYEH